MRYGFIGCGNMGGAIAVALAQSTTDIMLANRTRSKAEALAGCRGLTVGSNEDVARNCRVVFLGVKPQMMGEVLEPLRPVLAQSRPVLVTMAAGLPMERIAELAGDASLPVIRIMPNTPVQVGKGVILHCHNEAVESDVLETFLADMAPAGALVAIEETLMDAGCALSGCGPAFVYVFLDALAAGGEACGLSREQALVLAGQTLSGAAELALASDKTPERLRQDVCSPGGSTIEGVKVLEGGDFCQLTAQSVQAAFRRAKELGA